MALPSSGPLSMNDIAGEFGGSTPHALNEYYAGGGLVPAGTSGTYGAVPSSGTISIQNFYGTSNFVPIYIEDVFSTYLFTGTESNQTIVNGIDLATYGGLLWYKTRNLTASHSFRDSARGSQYSLASNTTGAQVNNGVGSTVFNTNGWTQGLGGFGPYNYASWTFRKQPKFFDIVTWTGDGTGDRTISHNLGSTPGFIVTKCTSTTSDWYSYHRSLGNNAYVSLNQPTASSSSGGLNWNPTSTTFVADSFLGLNNNGATYVAYLFAHDAGSFGLTGTDNVVSCGSVTGDSVVDLGYEPQLVIAKCAGSTGDWSIVDNMRGAPTPASGNTPYSNVLVPNEPSAETTSGLTGSAVIFNSTGFRLNPDTVVATTYIYIAIRRGPMKKPTTGTSVFIPSTVGATNNITVGFPADSYWIGRDGANWRVFDRLRSGYELAFNTTTGEGGFNYYPDYIDWDSNSVWYQNLQNAPLSNFFLRRAPGVFDTVCYKGNGVAGATQKHNLGAVPELMIVRKRTGDQWMVYVNSLGINSFLTVESSSSSGTIAGYWYATPTASVFYLSTRFEININNGAYVAYLFATLAGVSKVGSYTGTGALQTINCGFTGGARFVLIKRTDSTGDWFVYNSANGISSGDDPYRILNGALNLVQGTNYVDTTSVGFQVTAAAPAGLNASGGTYIFLAIA